MKNNANKKDQKEINDVLEKLLDEDSANERNKDINQLDQFSTKSLDSYNIPYISYSALKNLNQQNQYVQSNKIENVDITSSSLKNSNEQKDCQHDSNEFRTHEQQPQEIQSSVLQSQIRAPIKRRKTNDVQEITQKHIGEQKQFAQERRSLDKQFTKNKQLYGNQTLSNMKNLTLIQDLPQKNQQKIDSAQKSQNLEEDLINSIYKFESNQPKELEFLTKLFYNSQVIKINKENIIHPQNNQTHFLINQSQQTLKNLAKQTDGQQQMTVISDDELDDENKESEEMDEDNNLIVKQKGQFDINELITYKEQIKYQFHKIHYTSEMVQIRKQYRSKLFNSLIYATFFQFFVDNLISQIEQVVGNQMYESQNGYDFTNLSPKVTLYFAIFNVAFFPLLMGFIIDQIYSSIVMQVCILVMFLGRIITLVSILTSIYQIRILGQFFYQFGDSGFYLTSIYCIYFYFYDPANPRKFVQKITKYLGIGCSLPRNLSAIPMIFVYTASQKLNSDTSRENNQSKYNEYMPLLFSSPYKQITFSLITSLVLITLFYANRAKKLDQKAHLEMSQKNFNYIDNPLFKADLNDIEQNILNKFFIGVIIAGGLIYGLTSQNIIFSINKLIYNNLNKQNNSPPDLTLFVIVSGHELIYIMFIWRFGKIIMKDFSQTYRIWKLSGFSCTIYFLIHLLTSLLIQKIDVHDNGYKYLIYIFLFIINIFSGISFSTNVLCVDSILPKTIDKGCIGLGYAFMIIFKKFFELLGELSFDYNFEYGIHYITFSICLIVLAIIFWISKISVNNQNQLQQLQQQQQQQPLDQEQDRELSE